jgi:hypothetical protein
MKGIWKSAKASQVCRAAAVITVFAMSAASLLCDAQELAGVSSVLPTAPSALLSTETAASNGAGKPLPPPTASVNGTVTDTSGALIPGAKVEVDSITHEDSETVIAGDDGMFQSNALKPGVSYVIRVSTEGAATWTSEPIILQPGQVVTLNNIRLKMKATDSITVSASRNEIATAQVQVETQQRTFGFLPNFYVVYDAANAVPLTPKLKFQLAMRTSFDPVTIGGVAFMAGVKQAAKTPNYRLGVAGYGERLGETAATGLSDIMIGGAVLPSLLHQDPRYFYQGTGSKRSRLLHALSAAVVARGDNGKSQFNASSVGGDLAASALQMAYYPQSNRTALTFVGQFGVATAERTLDNVLQEFLFARFTSKARFHADSQEASSVDSQSQH